MKDENIDSSLAIARSSVKEETKPELETKKIRISFLKKGGHNGKSH